MHTGPQNCTNLPNSKQNFKYFPKIPSNFADKLYHLEGILNDEYSINTVKELAQLYKMGMECYSFKQPKKSIYFQKKLVNLVGDNIVKDTETQVRHNRSRSSGSLYLKSKGSLTTRTDCSEKSQYSPSTRNKKKVNLKLNEEIKNFRLQADTQIKNIVEDSQKIFHSRVQLLRQDLYKQQCKLQQRIKLKKLKLSKQQLLQPSLDLIIQIKSQNKAYKQP